MEEGIEKRMTQGHADEHERGDNHEDSRCYIEQIGPEFFVLQGRFEVASTKQPHQREVHTGKEHENDDDQLNGRRIVVSNAGITG